MVFTVGDSRPSPLVALVLLAVHSFMEDCLRQNLLTVLQLAVGRSQTISVTALVLSHLTQQLLAVAVQVVLVALLLLVLAEAPLLSCPSLMLPLLLLVVDLKLTLCRHHVSVLAWSVEPVELVEPWLEPSQ